jgi:hypothetical protein
LLTGEQRGTDRHSHGKSPLEALGKDLVRPFFRFPRTCVELCALLLSTVLAVGLSGASHGALSGLEQRQAGKLINLAVERTPDAKDKAASAQEYVFHVVKIADGGQVDGRNCWKLVFVPGDKVPAEKARRVAVAVDKEQGWPRKVSGPTSISEVRVQGLAGALIIVDAPDGIPLEIFPFAGDQEFRSGQSVAKLRQTRRNNETFVELVYSLNGGETLRVRQRWADGEDWWRYYEKYVDGRLVLRARLHHLPPLEDAFAKVDWGPPKAGSPLRQDKRLWVLVQVEGKALP